VNELAVVVFEEGKGLLGLFPKCRAMEKSK